MEEVMNLAKESPSSATYEAVKLNFIKPRPYQHVGLVPDSEKTIEKKERAWKKNNSPSPVSYRVAENFEKLSGQRSQDKSGRYFSLGKQKKILFSESLERQKKQIPGVGKYDTHLALDKVARPMKPHRI